jgi:hypothetical protein
MASLRVSSSVLLLLVGIQAVVCDQYESSSSSIRCYQCVNIESSFAGKSDPKCGTSPSSSNTVICPSGYNACGSMSGQISFSVFGSSVSTKVQIRGCTHDSSESLIGNCRQTNDLSNEFSGTLIRVLSDLKDVNVQGEVCTCKWDMCTLCSGGIDIAGYCLKYWIIAVASAGVVAVILLLITCCCCCCGCCCCKQRRHGVVLSSPVPYHTLSVIHTSSNEPPLSVQSGDITGYVNPLAGQAAGIHVDYAGPPSYETASKA